MPILGVTAMKNKRLHIGVCGIGFGHASRSLALIKALNENGWETSISSYGDGLRYLRSFGIDVKPVPEVSYGILPEAKVSIKMTIHRNLLLPLKFLSQIACELNYAEGASLVISDTRASTILAAKIAGKPVLTILNQFNIRVEYPRYRRLIELIEALSQVVGEFWALSDKILVTDYPPPHTISAQNLVIPDDLSEKVEFIGPVVEKKIDELPSIEKLCEKYGLDPEGEPIIFYHATGPSYERKMLTDIILPILDELSSEYQIIATLGGDSPKIKLQGVKVYSWIDEPLELIKLSSAVISRAGQTTLAKVLAYGKPVIMIPIPGHAEQLGNASSVAENGAGVLLQQERLSRQVLRKSIEAVLGESSFRENAEKYSSIILNLNPVEKIVSAAENLAAGGSL